MRGKEEGGRKEKTSSVLVGRRRRDCGGVWLGTVSSAHRGLMAMAMGDGSHGEECS